MTSSALDGVGDVQSPAPPAFSPLTDPAPDSTTREPSVNPNAVLDEPLSSALEQSQLGIQAECATVPAKLSTTTTAQDASSSSAALSSNHPTNAAATTFGSAQNNLNGDTSTALFSSQTAAMDLMDYSMDSSTYLNPLSRLTAMASLSQRPMGLPMTFPNLSIPDMPRTVRPSQVSISLALEQQDALLNPPAQAAAAPEPSLESFARIEFADSVFEMTTYAVIIGRDQRALDQARKDEKDQEDYQRKVERYARAGIPPPEQPAALANRSKFSKSYVSEEGGMLGPESDGEDEVPRPFKRRKPSVHGSLGEDDTPRASKKRKMSAHGPASGESHEPQVEAPTAEQTLDEKNINFDRQYVSHTPGAAAVDLNALRPSPHVVPFIGIHSPGPNIAQKTKSISRQHLKIKFNPEKGVFEAIPLHKNGFFCDDVHYKDEPVVLKSGSSIQIKDVHFVFVINGVECGKTGGKEEIQQEPVSQARRYSEGGKEMSFDFESSHDPERRSSSPEEVEAPVEPPKEESDSELSDLDEEMADAMDDREDSEIIETVEKDMEDQDQDDDQDQEHEMVLDPDHPLFNIKPEDMTPEMLATLPLLPPKKRGPGRPPKNGIMSKREERLRKKAAMELAKKNMPAPPPGEPPIKRKVGRPRKHPLPENTPDRPTRKYKSRKPREDGEQSDPEKAIKERRREKPKTPPLELNRESYTEEQLQKPNKNYGILIDEVLTAAPGGLSLKQIYKRIQEKYPYYYFSVDTKGWESSVRHNLIGNDAFKKNEEDHRWVRVPGIDIDAGKKRKAASPDHSSSHHAFGQHYPTAAVPPGQLFQTNASGQQGYRPGAVPQGTGYQPAHGQVNMGQHPHQQLSGQPVGAGVQQAPRQAYQTPQQGQHVGQAPDYGDQSAARPFPPNTQPTSYSSPYASRPPPNGTVQPGGVPQNMQRQALPPQNGQGQYNGLPRVNTQSPHLGTAAGARASQPPVTNGVSTPVAPAVKDELVKFVSNFKKTVIDSLSSRSSAPLYIAMSVINRGLGLATESMVPDETTLENIVLGVFEKSKAKVNDQLLHPGLVSELVNFKTNMVKTLAGAKMKPLDAERLILSAMDRVLGFTDHSTMQAATEAGKKEYVEAERVLMGAITNVVNDHQRRLATPAPLPTPGPPQPRATAPMPSAAPAYVSTGHPAQATPARQTMPGTVAIPRQVPGQPQSGIHGPAQPAPRPVVYTQNAPAQNTAQAQYRPTATAPAPIQPDNMTATQTSHSTAARPGTLAPAPNGNGMAPAPIRPTTQTVPQSQVQVGAQARHQHVQQGGQGGPAAAASAPFPPSTPHSLAQSLSAAKSQAQMQGAPSVQQQAQTRAPLAPSHAPQGYTAPTQSANNQVRYSASPALNQTARPLPVQGAPVQTQAPQSIPAKASPQSQPPLQGQAASAPRLPAQASPPLQAAQPHSPLVRTQPTPAPVAQAAGQRPAQFTAQTSAPAQQSQSQGSLARQPTQSPMGQVPSQAQPQIQGTVTTASPRQAPAVPTQHLQGPPAQSSTQRQAQPQAPTAQASPSLGFARPPTQSPSVQASVVQAPPAQAPATRSPTVQTSLPAQVPMARPVPSAAPTPNSAPAPVKTTPSPPVPASTPAPARVSPQAPAQTIAVAPTQAVASGTTNVSTATPNQTIASGMVRIPRPVTTTTQAAAQPSGLASVYPSSMPLPPKPPAPVATPASPETPAAIPASISTATAAATPAVASTGPSPPVPTTASTTTSHFPSVSFGSVGSSASSAQSTATAPPPPPTPTATVAR
ncbi:hypothetical protein QBC35DRAFT_489299 [Podospora australis]|uniref:Fork-head domain-containing protein n=1 Tax=Podospora australis TaxID=1536484 RepID=A0AAN6WYP8_9PEZI|nr:hypothetical protein QBC35DRAFT_489299 [Podospora australis]